MLPAKGTNKLPVTAPSFFHKHMSTLCCFLSVCPSGRRGHLVTAGWQAQDQARGPQGVGTKKQYVILLHRGQTVRIAFELD